MINVRGIANAAIQVVNPNIAATLHSSTGNTIDANYKQNPTYATAADVLIQVQAARAKDLEHVANLNMQQVYRNVRMWGNTQGVVRPDAKGGDLLRFAQVPTGTVQTWLVVAVLETWADWCSLIVCLQTDTAAPT
jgi:hypothetical protein